MQRHGALFLRRLAGASSGRGAAAACSPSAQRSFSSSAAAGDSGDDAAAAAAAGPLFYEASYDPAARNSVTITGLILGDPVAASLQSGVRVLKFPLGNKVGTRKNSFVVETYKDLAEQAEGRIAKGTRVVVHGWLKQDTWTNRETGTPRSRVLVVARRIGVLPRSYDVPEATGSSGGGGGGDQGEH